MAQLRPNILLILSDQHRYDCTGPAGHPLLHTPALDRLAREGVWFGYAFTPCPICSPARQSLLSGTWPQDHGGLWNYGLGLPITLFERPTWTEALSQAGYQLGYVGKWGVHPSRSPLAFGFHEYRGIHEYEAWRAAQRLPPHQQDADRLSLLQGKPAARWFGGVDPIDISQTRTHWCAARAIELMRRYAALGRPWHIRLDFAEPHLPPFPAEPFASLYPAGEIPPWGSFAETFANKPAIQRQQLANWGIAELTWDEWSHYLARYLGMISQIDDAIGLVLDALDELGLAEHTVVIYSSDHGDNAGGHRLIDKHYVMYEDVVRVPLVMRWPGHIVADLYCEAFVLHALDLAATACEAAGLPIPAHYAGRSLLPLAGGGLPPDWRQEAVSVYYGAQFGLYTQRMLRDARYKYVWNHTDVDELYDLSLDPWELHNLIDHPAYREVLADMRHRLWSHLEAMNDALVRNEWMRQHLDHG
ncbi:MAG: sulfatase-like hydrolase/transferase [Chloroflexi bacterium]|nr:sulfatase-like hydrolase/transferase [Chloroflexota bacterium]